MTKYVLVINSFLAGGAERSLLELLPRLEDRGVTPIVATLFRREMGFEEEARSSGRDVRLLRGAGRLAKAATLRGIVKDEKPGLVYTSLFDADLVGRLACIGSGVPVMSNLANTSYDPSRLNDPNVDRRRLRIAQMVDGFTARHLTDHFHAVSQAVKDSAVQHLSIPADRISVVRRGRDVSRLGESSEDRKHQSRRLLGIEDDAEVVISVGRQEYQKGHSHLISAFSGVVAERPRARLLIVGREGHSTSELRELIANLSLEMSVSLLGHRSDVPDLLAAADVFAFPSIYEGLGGALIEALALGLPVVASDLPAIREVVREGENALLVPAADPGELHAAIVEVLDDDELRSRFATRSRQLFWDEFRGDAAAERLVDLMMKVAR